MAFVPFRSRIQTGVGVGCALALILHLAWGGALGWSLGPLFRALFEGPGGASEWSTILWQIRLPRALACCLVGAILGVTGASFQMLFRNPLAEPFVVGVSGGAVVLGTLGVVAGWSGLLLEIGMVGLAVAGGLGTLMFVLLLGSAKQGFHSEGVLLAGVVVGTLATSLMTLILLMSGKDTGVIVRWSLGSMTPMFWSRVAILALVFAAGYALLWRESRKLNALALGELSAKSLGVDPGVTGKRLLFIGGAMASVAVGVCGIIGFLGMIAPNLVRRWVGADARQVLPLSGAVGAILLLIADLLAQRLISGIELPVGAVTAVLGAPALLWVLRQAKS